MLEVKNLSLTLGGKQLFEKLSFSVSDGEMLCITGVSGCGKTSLLNAVMGFLPVDGGFISIDGEQVTADSASAFRKMMSYVPQDLSFPCIKVEEMVNLPFSLHASTGSDTSKKRMMEEWQRLDLEEELYNKNVSEISGGQRQRMLIATARMLDRKIMIVDEPTSALDDNTSMIVADYLTDAARSGAIVLAVSHNAAFAARCNKTIAL